MSNEKTVLAAIRRAIANASDPTEELRALRMQPDIADESIASIVSTSGGPLPSSELSAEARATLNCVPALIRAELLGDARRVIEALVQVFFDRSSEARDSLHEVGLGPVLAACLRRRPRTFSWALRVHSMAKREELRLFLSSFADAPSLAVITENPLSPNRTYSTSAILREIGAEDPTVAFNALASR